MNEPSVPMEDAPAGREHDAFVAWRWLGWTWPEGESGFKPPEGLPPGTTVFRKGVPEFMPKWSLDNAAAHELLQAVSERFKVIHEQEGTVVTVSIVVTKAGATTIAKAQAETFPLAMCRAALAAHKAVLGRE